MSEAMPLFADLREPAHVPDITIAPALVVNPEPTMLCFTVYGKPIPQGSMKAFHVPSLNRSVLTTTNKDVLLPWRQQISQTAISLGVAPSAKHVAVMVSLDFYFERPPSVSEKKRPRMTTKPDIDKLIRAVFDALTGTLVTDDAQIMKVHSSKNYGLPERCEIRIGELK